MGRKICKGPCGAGAPRRQRGQPMNRNLKRLVNVALLVAVEFVLSRFLAVSTTFMKISFSFSAIALCGMLYGPLWAGLGAAITDVLGAVLVPQGGSIFLGFTLSAFLTGFVFGVFFYMRRVTVARAVSAASIVCLLVNFCLGSFWLYLLYGDAVVGMLPSRLVKSAVMIPVETLVILLLARVLAGVIRAEYDGYRAFLRRRAKGVPGDEAARRAASERICERVAGSDEFLRAGTVFCYVSVGGEVETRNLIALALQSGKRVCVPLCEGKGVMSARYIRDLSELREGSYGIPEPPADSPLAGPDEIDLALIPCSACDVRRNRLGKGAGFYDRYLEKSRAFRMGLCPRAMVTARLPKGEHDVPLDAVVCETRRF